MRSFGIVTLVAVLLGGCGGSEEATESPLDNAETPAPPSETPPTAADAPAPRWDLQASGEGTALALIDADGGAAVRLFCPAGGRTLLVNVPAFRPVASEERLSFGSGGKVVALVADTRGDAQRGGVSGTGGVPANLSALIDGPVAINHGFQNSGPHPAPPKALAQAFVTACKDSGGATPAGPAPEASPAPTPAGACMMQGGERLRVSPLRAVGTEPFWAARIEGRCVTYSHPEDQKGTRVWTRYTAGKAGGTWAGALGGQRFELRTRAEPGCSDGMSDKVYPIAVALMVQGEQGRGCAEPL